MRAVIALIVLSWFATSDATPIQDLSPTATLMAQTAPASSGEAAAGAGGSPLIGLKDRTWTAISGVGVPFCCNSKHTRQLYDSKRGRMVLAGGDYSVPENGGGSYSGQMVWAIDLARGTTWEKLHAWCAPPGGVQPNRPDNVTWVYDPKRDKGVMMPAFYGANGSGCPNVTETKGGYTFNFETRQWEEATWHVPTPAYGGDLHNHFGVLDPITDRVYRFYDRGGAHMQVVPLDGSSSEFIKLPGLKNLNNDQPAIDVEGRAIYVIAREIRSLVKYSIPDKKVVARIPLPATWVAPTGEFGGWEYETYLAFDSKNRVLLNPVTVGYGGIPKGLGIYRLDSKEWEWEAVPPGVSGNNLAYDVTNNVFLFLGRNADHKFWLYRYAGGG